VERRAIEAMGTTRGGFQPPVSRHFRCRLTGSRSSRGGEGRRTSCLRVGFPRASEAAVSELTEPGVRATPIRLAPSVHGMGDHGFVPRLATIAREKGARLTWAKGSTAGPLCIGWMPPESTGLPWRKLWRDPFTQSAKACLPLCGRRPRIKDDAFTHRTGKLVCGNIDPRQASTSLVAESHIDSPTSHDDRVGDDASARRTDPAGLTVDRERDYRRW
jgi:hypothetical protein